MRFAIGGSALLCASLATAASVPFTSPVARDAPTDAVNIKLQVVRHGYSCQNLITDCTTLCILAAGVLPDPILTDYGLNKTKEAAQLYSASNAQPDVVMSSALLRAMETALYTFPNASTVYQVPYVKEYFVLAGEQPLSVAAQDDILRQYDGEAVAARMNYTYVSQEDGEDESCGLFDSSPRCKASWKKFLGWLANTLATNPPVEIAGKLEAGTGPVTIALVTHSKFMEEEIIVEGAVAPGVTPGHVSNNEGFEADFVLARNTDTPTLTMAEGSLWAPVAGLSGVPAVCDSESKHVSSDDYARCQERNNHIFDMVNVCLK